MEESEERSARRVRNRNEHQSVVKGVQYETHAKAWSAVWHLDGQRVHKRFYVKTLGFDEAKRQAEQARQESGAVGMPSRKDFYIPQGA